MMNEILSYAIGLGPYVLFALGAGFAIVALLPWAWRNPNKWIFWVIFALSFGLATGDPSAEGSVIRQITWGTFFLMVGALLLFNQKADGQLRLAQIPIALVVLLSWILLSVLWSPEQFVSLKRAFQAVGIVMLGLMIGRMSLKHSSLIKTIAAPSLVLIYIGLIAAVLMRSTAFDTDGSFRGIAAHKNAWGQLSLIASLVFLFVWMETRKKAFVFLFALVPCVASLVLTRSTTSLLSFILISGWVALWRMIDSKSIFGKIVLIVLSMAVCIGFLGYLVYSGDWPLDAMSDFVYRFTGKDQSLTGRKQLWELIYLEITKHPWIGIGYGGFWTNGMGPAATLVAKLNWGPPVQAHNGYLDILNEIGVIGTSIFAFALVVHLKNILLLSRTSSTQSALFHFSILMSALLINYAESSLLRTTHIWWLLICASMFEVHLLTRTTLSAATVLVKPTSATVQNG